MKESFSLFLQELFKLFDRQVGDATADASKGADVTREIRLAGKLASAPPATAVCSRLPR
jgi:hypothetical protein